MQPQSMIIWKGLELLCYCRRYSRNSPVTGAVYVVQSWDNTTVTVKLHEDYVGNKIVADVPEDDGEESDPEAIDDEESGPASIDEEDPTPVPDVRAGDVYKLTHARAAQILRLQHALDKEL